MFTMLGGAKVFAIILTPVIVGILLLPPHTVFLWTGGLAMVGGLFWSFSELWYGLLTLVVGFLFVLLGRYLDSAQTREAEKAHAEMQAKINRMMSINLPTEDDK
ncbi:MAG: hypothetical protein ACPGXK_05550 [Phycisphaerae bacterium]